MKTDSDAPTRPGLEPVLRQLRRRIRRIQGGRGALITLVTAMAALLLLVLVDYRWSPLPQLVRWILTGGWLVAVLAAAFAAWWLPLRRPLELVRIARWLEIRHPELDERVSTVLELGGGGDRGMSPGLLDELARAAAADLAAINPQLEVSGRRLRRWLGPALALSAGWCALWVLAPDWTARHVVRALVPNSTLGNTAGTFIVEPGSVELIEDEPLRASVRYQGTPSGPLEIGLRLADGSTLTERLREEDGTYRYELDKTRQGFEYEIRSGRQTSDRFRVTVWPQPRLADARVRLEFPAYTNLAPREQELSDGVTAVAGTRAELRARLNTPVATAGFEIDGIKTGDTRLEPSAAGGSVTVRWPLATPGLGEARLLLNHRLGREFEGLRFGVETLADAAPEVKWTSPTATDLRVRPDEVLGLVYQATDDLGLGAAALEVEPDNGRAASLPQDLPVLVGRATPPVWRGEIQQPIGALRERWPRAASFKLRMRVDDSRPADLGGPGTAVSGWIRLRIDQSAEPLARQEVFAAHSDTRETLEKARQEIEQARWRIDSKRDELRKGDLKEPSRAELAKAREQLAAAREQLEQLAERMEESPHAAKADEVRQAAATAEDAREKLEETPLQDTEAAREQMANQAKQAAERAEQQLRKLQEEVNRAEPQLHDFARLKDLEQRQRELARQAEQAQAQAEPQPATPDPNRPAQEWQQQQAQMAWELRDLADQHPQARAEALAAQAAEARELAKEAREQAANQQALKDAAQAAEPPPQQPAAPNQPDPASLRAQLAQEQAAIRDQVNEQLAQARERQDHPTANALPEAARATEAAAEAIQQPDAAAAAQKADQAAKELAQATETARQNHQAEAADGQPPAQQQGQDQAQQQGQDQAQQQGQDQAQQKGQDQAQQQGLDQAQQQGQDQAQQQGRDQAQQKASPAAQAQAAEALADLTERQRQVAETLKALAAGNEAAARGQLAEMRAEQTAELAEAIREAPQLKGPSGPMQQAAQAAGQAANQANDAARREKPAEAATQHGEAAAQLQQAAANLDQAAAELANQANQAAGEQPPTQQAPMPGKPLAEAFQQASHAAAANSKAAAAGQAQAAADALAQAARDTKRAMQGQGPPQPGGPPTQAQGGMPQPGTEPGTEPDESSRLRQADPGVPPELAKLGISADDWEQIKSSLKAEVGGAAAVPLPEEYRDLVRKYFEQMTKGGKDD